MSITLRELISDDDVTLAYLTNIAEDLSTSSGDPEDFDEEAFAETIRAYVPPLSVLDCATLKEWIVSVARKLDGVTVLLASGSQQQQQSMPALESGSSVAAAYCRSVQEPEARSSVELGRQDSSADSACSSIGGWQPDCEQEDVETVDDRVALLLEMFGGMCSLTAVQKCLQKAGGSIDRAVQELLDCNDCEDGIGCTYESAAVSCDSVLGAVAAAEKHAGVTTARGSEDRQLKASILSRYGYVASDGGGGGSTSQYCPKPVTTEEKKLIRYRDGQVVSTKGERYMEVKKQESDEMKKTYISLKPLKKYRWH